MRQIPDPAAAIHAGSGVRQRHRLTVPWRALVLAVLPVAALTTAIMPVARAAGVDPLPAVAKALNGVTSYQVVVTSTANGTGFRRPSGTPRPSSTPPPGGRRGLGRGLGLGFGNQTRTITAVRKNGTFEDHMVITGKDRTGKAITTNVIVYGSKVCTESSGARAYTCQTSSQFTYSLDPTAAFAQGAGSTTFTHAGSKTVAGQACTGYAYTNQSQSGTTKGTVYISAKTNLPCEQDQTTVRHIPGGNGTFTQTSKSVWSRFNDAHLSVPVVPS